MGLTKEQLEKALNFAIESIDIVADCYKCDLKEQCAERTSENCAKMWREYIYSEVGVVFPKPCPFCGCAYEKDDDGFIYSGDHD